MKPVIVVLTADAERNIQTDVADALAAVLDSHVRHHRSPSLDPRVLEADLALADTAMGVLPVGAGNEQACWEMLSRSRLPLTVVPPGSNAMPRISRVLVPLDSAAVPESELKIARLLAGAGVNLTALHVFDRPAAPLFWDQAAHADQAWGSEFLARYCDIPGVPLELRSGPVAAQLLDVADDLHVDLILMSWLQILTPGRAQVVRTAINSGTLPVLLIPAPDPEDFGP